MLPSIHISVPEVVELDQVWRQMIRLTHDSGDLLKMHVGILIENCGDCERMKFIYLYKQKRKAVAVHAGGYNTAATPFSWRRSLLSTYQLRGLSLTLDAANPLKLQPIEPSDHQTKRHIQYTK